MVLQIPPPPSQTLEITWPKLPADYVLPDDPVENLQQPLLAAALTAALGDNRLILPEMLIASNFGLVAAVKQETVVKAPDWLYVPQVNPLAAHQVRRSYTPHTEGEPVALVMEFLSHSDCGELSLRSSYPYGKLYFYERIIQVPTYVVFDPADLTLEVRQLQSNQRYALKSPNPEGRYWIPELNLFLGTWYGTRLEQTLHWLRWWDADGNLLLWGAEQAAQEKQRADQEKQRADAAEAELEKLRARLQSQNSPDQG